MKKYKNGIFIGKFCPMHLGHVSSVRKLQQVCENVYVIFYNNPDNEKRLSELLGVDYNIEMRMRDAREIFKEDKGTIITQIVVPSSFKFPEDRLKIKALVEKAVQGDLDVQIFSAEEKAIYAPYIYAKEGICGDIYSVESKDGEKVPLHATLIRNNFDFYKRYLPEVVKKSLERLREKSKLVCVSGHSGSGKGVFCNLLRQKVEDCVVVDIDKLAHQALKSDFVKVRVREIFGDSVFVGGEIDRKKLGEIIFLDKEKQKVLYDLTWLEMEREINRILEEKHRIVVLDWYLIPSKNFWQECDLSVLILADDNLRKVRVLARDAISEEYYEKRNSSRYNYDNTPADLVVKNNKSLESLEKEVDKVCKILQGKIN